MYPLRPTACLILLSLSASLAARADDATGSSATPPPPQHEWIGKGEFGFLDSKGNSDGASVNGNIDLIRYDNDWKNELYASALYGESAGIVSAERYTAREQTDYDITPKLFAFGNLRYERDLFDGFQYQASLSTGLGYKFIVTDDDKLTAQLGVGFRRLRPETLDKVDGVVVSRTPLETNDQAIATAQIDYSHKFTPNTTLTDKFLMEYGSTDTMLHDEIALTVKMSTRLALSVGYSITDNSNPPAPLKKIDTLTTVNLVFAF